MKKIFNLTPPVQIELTANNVIGDVYMRIDVGADNTYESLFDFFGSSGSWDDHLMRLLQASGRADITTPLQARTLMQSTSATEFEAMCISGWNNMLKDLAARVNQLWKKATGQVPQGAHPDAETFFAAMLARTQASDATGIAVFTA